MMICNVCQSRFSFRRLFHHPRVPEYNLVYYKKIAEALASKTKPVDFQQCLDCGFVFNGTHGGLDYNVDYESSRAFSQVFTDYISHVIDFIRTNVCFERPPTIIEFGAGDCQFANSLVSEWPISRYFAIDPSYKMSEDNGKVYRYRPPAPDLSESTRSAYSIPSSSDLVIARHVLEHIREPVDFISGIVASKPTYVFIEVPCSSYIIDSGNYHFFSYEHCSYFDRKSLAVLMQKFGYSCIASKYAFNSENLLSLFKLNELENKFFIPEIKERRGSNKQFDFSSWLRLLTYRTGKRGIFWGASGKGVMLLNLLDFHYKVMPQIIDVNPKLSELFVPCTGNQILLPELIDFSNYDKILVLNSLYLDEVRSRVASLSRDMEVVYLLEGVN